MPARQTPRKQGLGMKKLVGTLAKEGDTTAAQIKKLGVERFADRKTMVSMAKTHVARKVGGRVAAGLVPGVGTALTGAEAGMLIRS